MTPGEYLWHLSRDGARLRDVAARDLSAHVPSCPDWDVADLVSHVARVYEHKVACMRLGRRPEESEYPREAPDGDVFAWFDQALATLTAELRERGPDAPSYTWFPPDQTVGFWIRRMAQETAVHRYDAELALGDVTPIDDAIALDGIDEVLVSFLGGPWYVDEPAGDATERTVLVRSGGRTWHLTLGETSVPVKTDGPGTNAELVVDGPPSETLLWLWGGRVSDDVVALDGPADLVTEFRGRLDYVVD